MDALHSPLEDMARSALAALDEIDYGIVVLDARARVWHANRRAAAELRGGGALRIEAGALRTHCDADMLALRRALADAAQHQRRRMLRFGHDAAALHASVLPLGSHDAALLILERRALCEGLTLRAYAAQIGLTPTEADVVAQLLRGDDPARIAQTHGVAISTVRSQLGSIRAKAGIGSLRDIACTVARLPPLLCLFDGCERAAA